VISALLVLFSHCNYNGGLEDHAASEKIDQ